MVENAAENAPENSGENNSTNEETPTVTEEKVAVEVSSTEAALDIVYNQGLHNIYYTYKEFFICKIVNL